MSSDDQNRFLGKVTLDLVAKVKQYDPALAQKTRAYMLEETNQWGSLLGVGAVLSTIDRAEKTRPEVLDKLQVEAITKVVMRGYWKDQGITVPQTIFDDAPASAPQRPVNSGQ